MSSDKYCGEMKFFVLPPPHFNPSSHKMVMTNANFNQKSLKYFNVMSFDMTFNSDEDHFFLMED